MSFDVAVVGAGCLLPDAAGPEELWHNLLAGRDSVREPDPADWPVDPRPLLAAGRGVPDRTSSLHGGWIGNPPLDPGVELPPALREALGRLLDWPVRVGLDALHDAGSPAADRCGLVLGGYPWAVSRASQRLFGAVHDAALGLGAVPAPPPADVLEPVLSGDLAPSVAAALGLGGPRYSIDAACATSLYAIVLAALHLRAGDADLMLAGASSAYDPLFTCLGFASLHALPDGSRSRPFDAGSDGLAPAEGCCLFVLERLEDARRSGRRVRAVLRAAGLSSDGRGRHVLTPNRRGQLAAYERAYAAAGVDPAAVGYVECHATGTQVGDRTEVEGLAAFFGGDGPLAGSAKSNLGHLLCAAGGAGLLKAMLALERREIPPTIGVERPLDGVRLVRERTPWPEGRTAAAVSAFGFGGTNAHLVLEGADAAPGEAPAVARGACAVVGADGTFGPCRGLDALARALLSGRSRARRPPPGRLRGLRAEVPEAGYLDDFDLDALRYRLPPRDLERLGAQHLLLLETADRAVADAGLEPGSRTAVLVALAADARVHRLQSRWELPWRLAGRPDAAAVAAAADRLHPAADVADFLGLIGNLAASRVAALWDFSGPAFAVAGGDSGAFRALDLARLLLAAGEADAAVVAAVDLAAEPETALLRGESELPGEGAGALVLRPLDAARADGARIHAIVREAAAGEPPDAVGFVEAGAAAAVLGDAHAASGAAALLHAIVRLRERTLPGGRPWLSARPRLAAVGAHVLLEEEPGGPRPLLSLPGEEPPLPLPVAAETPAALADALAALDAELAAGTPLPAVAARALTAAAGGAGAPLAACLVARTAADAREEARAARAAVAAGEPLSTPRGSVFAPRPLGGANRVAFVYPGVNSAYPAAGRDLFQLYPPLHDRLADLYADPAAAACAAMLHPEADGPEARAALEDELWRSPAALLEIGALYPALATWLLEDGLGLHPDHALGYSFGETAMLFALGVWRPGEEWRARLGAADVVHTRLGGPRLAVREHWAGTPNEGAEWGAWVVLGPAAELAPLLAERDDVYLCNLCAPREVVIAGSDAGCREVVRASGLDAFRAPDALAIHCPPARSERAALARLLANPVQCEPAARLSFSGGAPASFDEAGLAETLARGLVEPVDFPALVEDAYAAGARVFVEVGPGATCSRWIGEILRGREHVAAPTHRRGAGDAETVVRLVATLHAHRVPLALERFIGALPPAEAPELPHRVRLGGPEIEPLPSPSSPVAVPVAAREAVRAAERATAAQRQLLRSSDEVLRALAASLAATLPAGAPLLDQAGVLEFADGLAARALGPDFAEVDAFPRRVRFPSPPFLAVSRVLALDAERGGLGPGSIATEFDIPDPAWYALDGRVPYLALDAQGVLYLLAHMGVDRLNRGRRVFRWLDAAITFLDELPREGQTVRYDISVDSFVEQGDALLFFSDYEGRVDGRPCTRIERCCAGFFSDGDLARGEGIVDAHRRARQPAAPFAAPLAGARRTLGAEELEALHRGELAALGPGHPQGRNPFLRLPARAMRMIDRVALVDSAGGACGLGLLLAEKDLSPDDWYLRAHFRDDPVFAGPCMLEGAFQILELAALHAGLDTAVAGARFQPLLGRPLSVRFRGQVGAGAGTVSYRAEVVEIGLEPEPYVVADVEISAGGRAVGRLEDVGIRLAAGGEAG